MKITQSDIACLADADAEHVIAGLRAIPARTGDWFNIRVADALQEALDARRQILADLDPSRP